MLKNIDYVNQNKKLLERIEKKLLHYVSKAIYEFDMIDNHDKIMVCLSGGKDSFALLFLLRKLQQIKKRSFDLFSFTLDQSQPGWNDANLRAFLQKHDIEFEIVKKDTYSVVIDKIPEGKTFCSLCSRLRRGNIYQYARQYGHNKIALGHHRDDLIQSFMMSAIYNGEIRSMSPKYRTDNQQHVVIRPLVYCQEKDIQDYANLMEFPIIPCNLCGSQENLKRKKIKQLISELTLENPKVPSNLLHALSKVSVSQLMDKQHWNFKTLQSKITSTHLNYRHNRPDFFEP